MRIRKYLSFCIRKFSEAFYDFSIFLKKQSTFIYPFTSINNLDKQVSKLLPNILNSNTFYILSCHKSFQDREMKSPDCKAMQRTSL